MAILQLSRITHRKGLSENLPQLAGAEFGWVLDERKLFIGNGIIADGAPVIGNTEILTEFSDVLALASTYTYKGLDAGYVVATGPGTEDIARNLQSKFDDFVSVKAFGAVGDGATDDTDAINRALYELFCRESNVAIRRSLFFPAGTYKVSSTIKVPPHARLYGEGLTSSIIKFISDVVVNVTDVVAGTRYAITNPGTTSAGEWQAAAVGGVDVTGAAMTATADLIFIALVGPHNGTGTVREVASQVVETADSLQQTGVNLGQNGAEVPTGIEMASMAIYSTEDNTLLKLDSVANSGFHYLGLHGPNVAPLTVGYSTAAVEIASSVAPTHDVTISKLDTYGTTYALRAAGDVKGVVLENSGLDFHYQGVHIHNPTIVATGTVAATRYKIISLGNTDFTAIGADFNRVGVTFTASGAGTGTGTVIDLDVASPTGIVVTRNIFDNISREGIHFHNVLFNSSAFNVFYDVGNQFGGNATPITPVVHMETDQCISIGDLFEREDESVQSRIALLGNGGIALDSTHSIHLGSYERQVGIESILPDNIAAAADVFVFDSTISNSYRIDYNIKRNAVTRMGRIYVSNDGTGVTYNDEFNESGPTGVVLSITSAGTDETSELQFTTTSTGNDATLNYSIARLD